MLRALTSFESIHTKRISNCFFMGKPAAYCSSCFILPMTNLWIARRKAGWHFFQTWLGFHQDFAYIIFRFKCMKEPIFIERLIDMHAKTIASESNHRRKGLECLFQIPSSIVFLSYAIKRFQFQSIFLDNWKTIYWNFARDTTFI